MRGCQPLPAYGRAIIAVIALYALCLQALLVAAMPQPQTLQASGVICPAHDGASVPDDGAPPCAQHACCPAVQLADFVTPVLVAFLAVPWPPARATPDRWTSVALPGARAPPAQSVSPRGPPAV